MAVSVRALLLALVSSAASCQAIAGLNDPLAPPGAVDAAADSPALEAGADDAGAGDGGTSDGATGDASTSDSGCPGTGGPSMVNVGTFCIDSTEVTNQQYEAFLATNPSASGQPGVCSWNTDFLPQNGWVYDPTRVTQPIANVNWCDAYAFCAWAGKRMCGKIGGGADDINNYANPATNQHYFACSANGTRVFPYGNIYDPKACNGTDLGMTGTVAVATLPKCEGAFPGLWDMVGNVEEWQDACDNDAGAADNCFDGTGSYFFPPDAGSLGTRCDFQDTDSRDTTTPDIGIRCCAP